MTISSDLSQNTLSAYSASIFNRPQTTYTTVEHQVAAQPSMGTFGTALGAFGGALGAAFGSIFAYPPLWGGPCGGFWGGPGWGYPMYNAGGGFSLPFLLDIFNNHGHHCHGGPAPTYHARPVFGGPIRGPIPLPFPRC